MISLSIVVKGTGDTGIVAGEDAEVFIGTWLPLQGVLGIVSALSLQAAPATPLDPANYTVTIESQHSVRIAVKSGGTTLKDGDIVNIIAITEGEIARP